MSARIHRIAIAVDDLDAAIELYETIFQGKFERTGEAVSQEAGVAVASDWQLGIELVTPVTDSSNPITQKLTRFLAEHGEGIFAVGFQVDDMARALARGREAGIEPLLPTFKFTPEQLEAEFAGAFTRFEETVLDSEGPCGTTFALNVIEDAPASVNAE